MDYRRLHHKPSSLQVCICTTKAVCHPDDAEKAKTGLEDWKKVEEMNGEKIKYQFSSSRKVKKRSHLDDSFCWNNMRGKGKWFYKTKFKFGHNLATVVFNFLNLHWSYFPSSIHGQDSHGRENVLPIIVMTNNNHNS